MIHQLLHNITLQIYKGVAYFHGVWGE